MKRTIIGVSLLLLTGCSHLDVDKGLSAAQTGLAVVDVGADKLTDGYVGAVQVLREHCNGDEACEKKFQVRDVDVAKVTEGMTQVSSLYDQAAELLKEIAKSWGSIAPLVQNVMESAKNVSP